MLKKHLKNQECFRSFIFYAAFSIVSSAWVVYFIGREQFLYFGDFANFQSLALMFGEYIRNNSLIDSVKVSVKWIGNFELNPLPILHMLPFTVVFGKLTRVFYVLLLAVPYMLAVAILLDRSTRGLLKQWNCRIPNCFSLIPLCIVFFWAPLWNSVLLGFPDVGGLAICLLCWHWYFSRWNVNKSTPFVIGFLLVGLFCFRRWYFVWACSFLFMAAVDTCVILFLNRKEGALKLLAKARPFFFMCVTSAVLFAPFFYLRFLSGIQLGAATVFAPYRAGTTLFGRILSSASEYFGLVHAVLLIGCIIVLWMTSGARRPIILLVFQQVLSVVLFAGIQIFAPQHVLIFLPSSMLIIAAAVSQMMLLEIRLSVRWTLVVSLLLLESSLFFRTFVPWFSDAFEKMGFFGWTQYVLPTYRHFPWFHPEISEMRKLHTFLKHSLHNPVVRQSPEDSAPKCKVYVLGANWHFDWEMLADMELTLHGVREDPSLYCQPYTFDGTRCTFPIDLLTASYVVVSTPIRTHLNPSFQKILMVPAESFVNGRNIAKSFRELPAKFYLKSADIRVRVFERFRTVSEEERNELASLLEGVCSQ